MEMVCGVADIIVIMVMVEVIFVVPIKGYNTRILLDHNKEYRKKKPGGAYRRSWLLSWLLLL